MKFLKNGLFAFVSLAFVSFLIYACARPGMPQGGLDDLTPPHYVSSKPKPDAINFRGNKIEIIFDELVNVEKPGEKVIITPPQKKNPVIQSIGKKVTVELKDTLMPNTTYTFDFTDAIVDNNEKNVLENFSFAFSTGEIVDSLMIGGLLFNAENLEPMPGIMVGLHSNMSDTAFTTIPFLRTTKTNELGQFRIRNVSPGTYHIFALNDLNRDYKFDQPGEDIAFLDSVFVPSFEPAMRIDTVWKDSITVDTIKEVKYTRFTPDDIRLFLFKEDFERQFLSRPLRNEYSMVFNFNSAKQLEPTFSLLNQGAGANDWAIPERANDGKSITLWIKDSLIYNTDSLMIEVEYLKSDSLNQLVHATDTFNMILKKKTEKKKDKKEAEKINFLEVNFSMQGSVDVFDTAKIVFGEPVPNIDLSKIIIEEKVDTLWEPVQLPVVQDSLNPRLFYIDPKWAYEKEYRISIDSASIYSLYGKWNDKLQSQFKFKKNSDYGHLYVSINGNGFDGFGELLDNGDKVIRKSKIIDGELIFINLKPGKYYLRYIEDANGDGKWTTGNYTGKQQPETVYYYPGLFEIKQNFEFEQTEPWNVSETPVEKQKPLDIIKNKPKEKKTKQSVNASTNTSNNTNRGNSIQNRNGSNSRIQMPE
ncbi:hypothetical protein FACS1894174_06230 [Bacteroidia bacterium]|nr:hypothetical protein FACS1894174_06230 [Bacteroidia bacterium]